MSQIKPIRMPKWGLAMEEGTVVGWLVALGDTITEGDEIVEIETPKITNVLEATNSGTLARTVAQEGEVMPVGSLIAVLTEGDVAEADIDAFLAAAPAVVEEDEEEAEGDVTELRTVIVGGQSINVALAGSGTPIVLLHGFSGDYNNWLFAMEDLKSTGRIIAPDLPGHGASSKQVGDGSLAGLAATVAGLLDELGIDSAVIVGHSLGGAVAIQVALSYPDRVRALSLICPVGLPSTTLSGDFLNAVIDAEKARDVRKALQMLVMDPAAISRDMADGVAKYLRLDGAREALTVLKDRLLGGADITVLQENLAAIPAATVIATRADTIVGVPIEADLPAGWDVVWVDGAKHLPHLEAAQAVNRVLRGLLDRAS